MRIRTDIVTCYAVRPTADGSSHEFLQLRRKLDDFMGGTWQAVSGGIEEGETAWQAALRELREEAGLVPVEFYRLSVMNTFYVAEQDAIWNSVPFCAMVDPAAVVQINEEHDAVRWIPREQVGEQFMWATDRNAIAELCRTILDDGLGKPFLRIPLP